VKTRRLVGLVLLVLGILGLAYGGFTYTQETHDVDLGPIEFQVKEKERVNVPVWLGVTAVAVGAVLLLAGRPR
jgi:hypothetical protein